MNSYFRLTIFVIVTFLVPIFCVSAIDFDQDGMADFIVVDINSKKKIEWYAVDINDAARRSLGEFGVVGNHLAVGNWSGNDISSKALISKRNSGEFEWDLDLPAGRMKVQFGSYPSKVVSGFDLDNNGAIDPAVVTAGSKSLEWKLLSNPGLSASPTSTLRVFGSKGALPFYANLDGSGDQLGYASVNNSGVLVVRSRNLTSGKIRTVSVNNFKFPIVSVLPVKTTAGNDILFIVSRNGKKLVFTIVNDKKQIKKVAVVPDSEDAVVVGNYLGGTQQVVAVRKNSTEVTILDSAGKTSVVSLALAGILVDDININSFSDSRQPRTPPSIVPTTPPPPSAPQTNPTCSGVMLSTDHLLYKPVSDTSGNAVVVFDSIYKKEFVSVAIQLKDGSFAEGWWKGLALWGNPDAIGPRQHWRTNHRASEVADNALIIANDGTQECRYTLPGSANRRWE